MRALKIAFTFLLFAIAVVVAASCGGASSHSNPNAPGWSSHDLGGDAAHANVLRGALVHRYR
jgi:hypothetical protein